MTSAGTPPSLPPFSFTASWKASRISTPSAALGPDSVLTKPTRTLSAACTPNAAAAAIAARMLFIPASSWKPPILAGFFCLGVERQHARQRALNVAHAIGVRRMRREKLRRLSLPCCDAFHFLPQAKRRSWIVAGARRELHSGEIGIGFIAARMRQRHREIGGMRKQ